MKVINAMLQPNVRFGSIHIGDCCIRLGKVWMKALLNDNGKSRYLAIDLEDGSATEVDAEDLVYAVPSAEIKIS